MGRALVKRGVIAELKKRIELAEENKKKLIYFLQDLKEKYLDGQLTYSEYEDITEEKRNGRTIQEWFEYYDNYIEECEKRIKQQERKILRGKIIAVFSLIFVISFLFIIAFYITPSFIGYIVKEPSQEFTQQVNLEFSQSQNYEWQLENPGLLQSLKISGSIEGSGEVKIYLDNLLILDSNKLKEKQESQAITGTPSPITGLAIEEAPQPSPSQEEPLPNSNITQENYSQGQPEENISPSQEPPVSENITQPSQENITEIIKEFTDICEETCDLSALNLNQSSYTLRIEITNAKLFLKEIKYEISSFPAPEIPIPEIPENITAPENVTIENITLIQEPAEIGKPVKWKARIKALTLEEAIEKVPELGFIISSQEISTGNFEISYETPAPYTLEEKISEKAKKISIVSEIYYTNITTYTTLTREVKENKIKLYYIANETKQEINFTSKDTNNNNLIDYVEWTSSSNEIYELVIEISKAEHLDENRNFISDIYNETYKLDNIWSEKIYSNEYVRVTFQQNLTSGNDITIYARNEKQERTIIEVYNYNSEEKIAEFPVIEKEDYYRIFLNNMQGSSDTFDLKIKNLDNKKAYLEIDHIIDPTYNILFINATEANWASTDFPTVTNCDAGSLDVDDVTYCGNTMSIEAEIGFVNSTHSYNIPSTATITEVTICTRFFLSNKMDDNAADTLKVRVGENSTGTWTYTEKDSCIYTGCTAWKTESTHCYDVTATINTPLKASNVRISLWISQGDADANQDVTVDHNYVNISYTTPDTTPPDVNLTYPLNTTYNVNVSFLNYTVGSDATFCMYYNGTNNATMTCGINLTMVSIEGSQTWIVYANDSTGNQNSSNVTFVKDTFFPIFSNYLDNNATYSGEYARFNVTITNTNATVILTLNGTNYTANNLTATIFNVTVNLTITGDYNYTWHSWGNGSLRNYNYSALRWFSVNVTPSLNVAPQITYVENKSFTLGIDPLEENYRIVQFNTTIYDDDGVGNINSSGVKANFTRTNEALRENSSCTKITGQDTSNSMNFSCTIDMWYWDGIGTWDISVYGKDNSSASAQNLTTTFAYNQLQAIKIDPKLLMLNATSGATNQTAYNDPTVVNNTGNYNASTKLAINAIDIHGETVYAEWIGVSNFSVGGNTGGTCTGVACIECNETKLVNFTDTTITGIVLERGNLSLGIAANDSLYYCLMRVPTVFNSTSIVSSQVYSTNTSGTWTIKVLIIFIFAPQLRRRKRKQLKDDKLMQTLELIVDELKEKYSLDKTEIVDLMLKKLKARYKIDKEEIINILEKEQRNIPVTIFSKNLGALESLIKYMKENLNLRYKEIASLLNRDERTIWSSYNKAIKKEKKRIKPEETSILLPISIFQNRNFTILESIILYLRGRGMKHKEIAKLIERDPRNISTIYSRAVKKIERKVYK